MITEENQELNEGIKYLKAYSLGFDPDKRESRTLYTFALIEKALERSGLSKFINDILELVIFDSIIGNGDRHQENWAIVTLQRLLTEVYEEYAKKQANSSESSKNIASFLKKSEKKYKEKNIPLPELYYFSDNQFAPIYDSGSSLGRELTNEAVEHMLSSDDELDKYVSRGLSEIHWENKKVTHFELIRNLLESSHRENILEIIERVIQNYNSSKIEQILKGIDQNIPESHAGYKIPEFRKRLILKIITLRFEKLKALLNE